MAGIIKKVKDKEKKHLHRFLLLIGVIIFSPIILLGIILTPLIKQFSNTDKKPRPSLN